MLETLKRIPKEWEEQRVLSVLGVWSRDSKGLFRSEIVERCGLTPDSVSATLKRLAVQRVVRHRITKGRLRYWRVVQPFDSLLSLLS